MTREKARCERVKSSFSRHIRLQGFFYYQLDRMKLLMYALPIRGYTPGQFQKRSRGETEWQMV
jgi:hypothetical protein